MPSPDYNHERYSTILTACVEGSDWDLEAPISGQWIEEEGDPFRVMFDSYQEDDTLEEGEDKNLLCYVVFIHKDCLEEDFVFPEHETAFGVIKHRPEEEAALIGWYNKSEESWDWLPIQHSSTKLSTEQIMDLLEGIWAMFWGRAS